MRTENTLANHRPHHTRLTPTLLLARALRLGKYPLSKILWGKVNSQQIYLTPAPVSSLSRKPPTPFFYANPVSDIFLCYKFGVGFITGYSIKGIGSIL
jgi:hypothetical protein